ncbi:hypothetical protein [Glutamicibacter sp. TV12E]|uniref:hypothetical protein n=1 Tax=Glutamicibacter sp. TV12E TaxID=3446362 RepID=UPI0040349865
MAKYTVRLIYPSGTTKDVLHTDSRDEAEGYIKASKELRPRVRHQLGTAQPSTEGWGHVCRRSDMGLWA